MFMGITFEKLLLIGVLAAFLIGPERLPRAAEALSRWVKRGREYLRGAQGRLRDEMGSDFDDVDWRRLDPRKYDPRRIIREALLDDAPVAPATAAAVSVAGASAGPPSISRVVFSAEDPPPFDSEAT
ncbi:MAG TPA: Sec-independent protein translocase TatB [Microbacterium sp.]|nr:Sec-independent protein translocase TatB [Microbacterium sp.]